ncbi:DUF4309 domain-containing protein [Bacillus sp. Marseille-Q1617]|uniref:DUF4309 domain-containing protein n=1 Tax=Bacillus sp. Marseille-Q1617 TaxID=2736887 RepID=UPI00158B53A3|nr:DUF4309 domain-containing protein [Bacillus sp. Marseille-Q1617]
MKKFHMAVGFVIISAFILMTGYELGANDKYDFYSNVESTDLSGEMVNSISLSSKKEDVLKRFGLPEKTHQISKPKTTFLVYKDIQFGLKNNEVFRYFFSDNHSTSERITAGDPSEKVIETYGSNYYERTDTGAEIIGYFDKQHHINIEFSFYENKVIGTIIEKIN